jgi:hypothetical protein
MMAGKMTIAPNLTVRVDFIFLHWHCTSGYQSPEREHLLHDIHAHAVEEASHKSIRSREPVDGTSSTIIRKHVLS